VQQQLYNIYCAIKKLHFDVLSHVIL